MSHYRRITQGVLQEMKERLSNGSDPDSALPPQLPSDYEALASIHAVAVGRDGTGALLVEVAQENWEALPGAFAGNTLADLTDAARKAVARARILVTDEEGNEVELQVPEGEIPEGAEVLETGILPHAFAH